MLCHNDAPGFTACFDTLNSRQPPVPCASMISRRPAPCADGAKKFSSKLLRNVASSTSPMRPCHAAPAFDTTMSTPPNPRTTCVECRRAQSCVGHVAWRPRAPRRRWPCAFWPRRQSSISSSATSAPAAANALAVAAPIAPPAPVIDRDLARERQRLAWPSLACSKRPVFDVEHVVLGDRLEAADRLGVGDAFDRGLGEIGGDRRVLLACGRARTGRGPAPARRAAADRASSGAADAGVLAREIGLVVVDEGRAAARAACANSSILPRGRRRQHQRPVLDADGDVRRDDAFLAVARHVLAVDEIEDRVA